MNLSYKSTVYKQLKALPLTEKKKILRKIEQLSIEPYVGKLLKGEYQDLRSLKAWPYRIIYEIKNKSLIILSIVHRQSAY